MNFVDWYMFVSTTAVFQVIAQALGIVAMVIACSSFQAKKQKTILTMQTISTSIFTVHFLMLGALCGSLLNFVAMLRASVYSRVTKNKWAAHPVWIWVFSVLSVGVYAANFLLFDADFTLRNALVELLPTTAMVFTCFSMRFKEASKVRLGQLVSSPFWLTYNVFNHYVGGILTEVIASLSVIIGILRLDRKKKNS